MNKNVSQIIFKKVKSLIINFVYKLNPILATFNSNMTNFFKAIILL